MARQLFVEELRRDGVAARYGVRQLGGLRVLSRHSFSLPKVVTECLVRKVPGSAKFMRGVARRHKVLYAELLGALTPLRMGATATAGRFTWRDWTPELTALCANEVSKFGARLNARINRFTSLLQQTQTARAVPLHFPNALLSEHFMLRSRVEKCKLI